MADHRYALTLSPALRDALLPHVDADTSLHLRTVLRTVQGDLEVPLTTTHLRTLARAAAQHPEIPSATRLLNIITANL